MGAKSAGVGRTVVVVTSGASVAGCFLKVGQRSCGRGGLVVTGAAGR